MAQLNMTSTVESTAATGAAAAPRYFSMWTAASGGTLVATGQLTNTPAALQSGDKVTINSGETIMTLTRTTSALETLATRGLEGIRTGGTIYVQAHSAAPGPNGTSNVITQVGRIAIAAGNWTVVASA